MADVEQLAGAGGFEILLALPSAADAIVREARQARQAFLAAPGADNLRGSPGGRSGGYRVERRVALVPVIGPLVPRGPAAMTRYGVTSYEGLRDELRRAGDDNDVDVVALMVDSPGGYVTGIDATSDAILAARGRKPVVAIVEGLCASAAYWLASQCDAIVAAPFANLGSIGAIIVHLDVSRALDAAGLTVTVVRAGARKAEAMPLEPLTDEAEAEMQADVDRARQAFAAAVVAGRARPGLDIAAVLATEARVFHAEAAVAMGLADRIGTLDGFVARMPAPATMRRPVPIMLPSFAALEPVVPAAVMPALAAAPGVPAATVPAPIEPSGAPAATDAVVAERARITGILNHTYASQETGRVMAEHFVEFGTSVSEAHRLFDWYSKHVASAPTASASTLEQEMLADVMPLIGSDGGGQLGGGQLTEMQEGAASAARLQGKDVAKAVANAGKMMPTGRER